jgi:putative chitinase
VTPEQLDAATGCGVTRARLWAPPITAAMAEYEIDSKFRQCAFLAQTAHESGRFMYVREQGSSSYLDRYDTGRLAARLGNTPEDDDDGQLYRGRGLIQVTGRRNYALAGAALGLDLLEHPELLEEPENAARSAGWFWKENGLNALADQQLFSAITRRINGGLNGLDDRTALYHRALAAF